MTRKYSAGDIVLLTQKKEVKKGHHCVNLNGIRYAVSSDFDGLLLVICYRADLGAYCVREFHGSERRQFNIPPSILDRYSQYAKPRNKFSVGKIVLVTPKGSREVGDFRELRIGDSWVSAVLGNVWTIKAANEQEELYLICGANGARAALSWSDLESCAEILPDEPAAKNQPNTPTTPTTTATAQATSGIKEIPLYSHNPIVRSAINTDIIHVYSRKGSSRVCFAKEIVAMIEKMSAFRIRMFSNELTGELFLVFSEDEGLEFSRTFIHKNKAISNKSLVDQLVSAFHLDSSPGRLKISGNLSKSKSQLTFKVLGKA